MICMGPLNLGCSMILCTYWNLEMGKSHKAHSVYLTVPRRAMACFAKGCDSSLPAIWGPHSIPKPGYAAAMQGVWAKSLSSFACRWGFAWTSYPGARQSHCQLHNAMHLYYSGVTQMLFKSHRSANRYGRELIVIYILSARSLEGGITFWYISRNYGDI